MATILIPLCVLMAMIWIPVYLPFLLVLTSVVVVV